MKILNPAGVPRSSAERALPTMASLAGRRLAVLNNRWKSMDRIAARIAKCEWSRVWLGRTTPCPGDF